MSGLPILGWISGNRTFTRAVMANSEQSVDHPEHATEQPTRSVERDEAHVVGEREHGAGEEMEEVTDQLGQPTVRGDRRAQEEREVDPRQPELAGRLGGSS